MADFFFYGTLCHVPLLQVVLGRDVPVEPAVLPGHAVHWADGQTFPLLVEALGGGGAAGLLVRGLAPADVARVDFYEGGFGYGARCLAVTGPGGPAMAQVYMAGAQTAGAVWDLAAWEARFAAIVCATAVDFMALFGRVAPGVAAARYGEMLVRGAGRVRAAAEPGPVTQRRFAGPGDVRLADLRQPYAHFFAVEEYDVAYRRFDGQHSPVVTRAVFVSGDAVTVLPYDPRRDRVLLVEQFRIGPVARGSLQPWLIEPIAGRIDPGETPQDCARREALEEAGLHLGALLPVAEFYPSPGAVSEYLYAFVALTDLPDGAAGVFGLAGEAEDIRGHLVSFDDLMRLVASGEVANAPLILTALWLQRERGRLRG